VTCETCGGFGNVEDDYAYVTCETCGGSGALDVYEDDPTEQRHRQC
jgi:DnaJ-class molecular chaperone